MPSITCILTRARCDHKGHNTTSLDGNLGLQHLQQLEPQKRARLQVSPWRWIPRMSCPCHHRCHPLHRRVDRARGSSSSSLVLFSSSSLALALRAHLSGGKSALEHPLEHRAQIVVGGAQLTLQARNKKDTSTNTHAQMRAP